MAKSLPRVIRRLYPSPSTLYLLPFLILAGCDQPEPTPAPTPVVSAASATKSQPAPTIPTHSPVPANLKTLGYDYYGLDNREPLPMKETTGDQELTGAAITAIVSVSKDKAVFDQTWTGDLANHADSEVLATPDGIYAVSLYGQTLPTPQKNLPADPTPGKTWSYEASVTAPNGADVQEKGTDKIVGIEKLQIGKKTYDALRIDEAGTSRVDQKVFTDTATRWLVKGLGTVKLDTKSTSGAESVHSVIVADID